MSQLGIRKTRSTPLHPQSEGQVERLHRTLYDWLAKMIQEHQGDWDLQLPIALLAYRSSEHSTTGYSPAFLVYGRELSLPVHMLFGKPPNDECLPQYVDALRERIHEAHTIARERLMMRAEDMKRRYDIGSRMPRFQEGDRVWLHNPRRTRGRNPKLQCPWEGPCTVVKRLNDVVFRIRNPKGKLKVVHADRLTPYCGL